MAKISEQFIWVDNDTEFKLRLEAGDVQEESIAFISKPKLIWTHNTYFNCYYTLKEIDDKNKELDSKIESEREALELSLKDSFYEIQDFTLNASPTEDLINASIGSYDKLKDAIDNGDIILVTRPGSAGKSTAVAYKDNSNNIIVTYPHFDNNDWTVLAVIKSPAATVSSEINKSEVHVIKPRYIIEVNKSLDTAVANDIKTAITDSELKEAIDNEIPSFIRFTGENNVTFTPVSILLADGITYLTWVVNNYCWIFKQETDKETLTKLNFTDYVKKAGDTMTGDLTFNGTNLGIKTLTPSKTAPVYALEIKEENQNGSAVLIGAGGNTFIGSGESAQSVYAVKKDTITPNGEETYITSDSAVHIITNTQNVGTSSPNLDGTKSWIFKKDGDIYPPSGGLYLGNASTATKLATTRKIWGNDFDGSKDISYIQVTKDNKDVLDTTTGTAFFDVRGGVLTDKDTTDHVIFQVDSLYESYQLRCDADHLVHRFNERQTEGWTDWHTTANKSDIPTTLKNPKALKAGSKSYDGSAEVTLTHSDVGAAPTNHTHNDVSDTTSGFMTPEQKKKIGLVNRRIGRFR